MLTGIAPGDYLAFLGVAIDALNRAKDKAEKAELVAMRAALRSLYFSDETIRRLERIPSLEEFDALNYEAGRASTKQRDTRNEVAAAFSVLRRFLEKDGLSIEGSRLIQSILNTKFEVRHEIEAAYFSVIKRGDNVQTAELVEKIRGLNSLIEQLDTQLGGLILSGK